MSNKPDCLFCKMIRGDIETDKVMETDRIFAFRDINPQAPTHILIIPKKHIPTVNDIKEEDGDLVGEMVLAAKKIAGDEGVASDGYRLVFNCNKKAGQAVFHIHLHLLGGRSFSWPPG